MDALLLQLVDRITCPGLRKFILQWHVEVYAADLFDQCQRLYARLLEQLELYQALQHYYDQFAHEYFSKTLHATLDLAQIVSAFRQVGGYETPAFRQLLFRYERLSEAAETVLHHIPLLASRHTLRRLQFVRPQRPRIRALRVLARGLQDELQVVDQTLRTVPDLGRCKLRLLQFIARYLFERASCWHWRVYYTVLHFQPLSDALLAVFHPTNAALQRFLALNLNDDEAPSKSSE
jgi:hypothetical protein